MCEVLSAICTSPIGRLTISYCLQGLHSISQISTINDRSFLPHASESIEYELPCDIDDPILDSCREWLDDYFHAGVHPIKTPKLCPTVILKGNSFQENVWYTLLKRVPFGHVITYGELAKLAGNTGAARAVGTAMRRNPFQLIVPCHRVICSNGKRGNYGGGERNSVKVWLLKHEQIENCK
ncbi:unnamed protein product [Adineta ricciae]|uniref:Methylated-DNA--protein-cysteine methyltransferase n=1 Tax=Adineta ricciae TaxID=249248 RepID=A0A816CZB9_ADIRI|nr:unnamed protein product [Adineta ricciae]